MSVVIPDEAKIYSSVTVGAINNIVDTSYPGCSGAQIGAYIYRSAVAYSNHIRGYIEPNAGAHYYLQTAERTNLYNESFLVDLSQVTIDPKGMRRGFISLSFISSGTNIQQCDFGIACDSVNSNGRGKWYPVCWCRNYGNTSSVTAYPATSNNQVKVYYNDTPNYISDGTVVKIYLAVDKVDGMDVIYGAVYNNSTGAIISDIQFNVTAGVAFDTNYTRPKLRFERFMSLVPFSNDTDDADYSYLNATIYDCRINGTLWGNSTSDIQYCWSCQGANITSLRPSTLAGDATSHKSKDEISIYHQYQLH